MVVLAQSGGSGGGSLDHKITSQAGAPTVNDDADAGFSVGDVIIDTSASPNEAYVCTDTTNGAAVWEQTTLDGEVLTVANNLSDLGNAATARGNLGFSDPILDKGAPGEIGGTTPPQATFSALAMTGNILLNADDSPNSAFIAAATQTGGPSTLTVLDQGGTDRNFLTSAVVTSAEAVLDEDNLSSNSATHLATQQSIKAYVDSQSGGGTSIESADTHSSVKTEEVAGSVTVNAENNAGNGTVRVAEFAADESDNPQLVLQSGSRGEPSLAFTGNLNSGLRDNTFGSLAVDVDGAVRLLISSFQTKLFIDLDMDGNYIDKCDGISVGSVFVPTPQESTLTFRPRGSNSNPSQKNNSVHFYARDVSSSAEAFVMDEAANTTQLSPHPGDSSVMSRHASDPAVPWAYDSTQQVIGTRQTVDMLGVVRGIEWAVEKLREAGERMPDELAAAFDAGLILIQQIAAEEKMDWAAEEARKKQEVEAGRAEAERERREKEAEQLDPIEVSPSEALEDTTEKRRRKTGRQVQASRHKLQADGKVEQVTEQVDEVVVDEVAVKKPKKGVRFDEKTGKFYRRATADDVPEQPIEEYALKPVPDWLQAQGVRQ